MREFPKEVAEQLQYYVYRLIDPRNGQTFYVGKGKGNRVFAHAQQQIQISDDPESGDDDVGLKLRVISEIRNAGLSVNHVIHRHGLDEKTAFEVEAALMEAYPGLTNIASGYNNYERGCAHVSELVTQYKAEEIPLDHQCIAINVSRSLSERKDIYEATRYCWKIAQWRREIPGVPVLAYTSGIVRAVFDVESWLPATSPEFSHLRSYMDDEGIRGRWGFVAKSEAGEILRKRYLGKRLPATARSYGSPLIFLGPGWSGERQ
jgi:hypothetical protein